MASFVQVLSNHSSLVVSTFAATISYQIIP